VCAEVAEAHAECLLRRTLSTVYAPGALALSKENELIEAKVIYKRQLCLLDSFMSLDTSDESQPPFSSMLCSSK